MEHSFDVDVAVKYGIPKAVILKKLSLLIIKNFANRKNIYDEISWVRTSQEEFSDLFPYLSMQKVGRHLREMEKIGLIESGNFNTSLYDRTKWYTVPSLFRVNCQK